MGNRKPHAEWEQKPAHKPGPKPEPEPEPGHPGLECADDEFIEGLVEARLARRFEAEAFHWRVRLIAIETVLMGSLVLVAGLLLRLPFMMVVRASVLIAGSCLVTGLALVGLSAAATRLARRIRERKPQ
jgi:hypothetical protein